MIDDVGFFFIMRFFMSNIYGNDCCIDNIEFNVGDIVCSKVFYGIVFGWIFIDYGLVYIEFNDGCLCGGFIIGELVVFGGLLVILYVDDLVVI